MSLDEQLIRALDLILNVYRTTGKDSCIDYIEFGQEDVIPFITLKRSGRLCGTKSKQGLYDDPGGQLLIWLKLGQTEPPPTDLPSLTGNSGSPADGQSGPDDQESSSRHFIPRVTLVITPYSSKPDLRNNQLKKCRRYIKQKVNTHKYLTQLFCRGNYWIRKNYFCDGRVNCPEDNNNPLDEADISCATTPVPPTPSTTESDSYFSGGDIMVVEGIH